MRWPQRGRYFPRNSAIRHAMGKQPTVGNAGFSLYAGREFPIAWLFYAMWIIAIIESGTIFEYVIHIMSFAYAY